MKKLFLFTCIFLILAAFTNAQNSLPQRKAILKNPVASVKRHCGTMECRDMQKIINPAMEEKILQNEEFVKNWVANHSPDENKTTYTIPVVFHIIYANSTQNLSDARCQEQITASNIDYAGLSTHSMGSFSTSLKANTELQFCLATKDPSGNTTTGIERRQNTSHGDFSALNFDERHTSTGGMDAWDVNKYMNVWVCDLGGGYCGYAQFPTNPLTNTYGITNDYRFTGLTGATAPYNLGGTFTHEIGHCFGLYHIWGDDGGACTGTDYCTDTPNQASEQYGTPTGVVTDACTGTSPGIMYMNFMDYSDDAAYANFTPGQKTIIQAQFAGGGALYTLGTSTACTGGTPQAPVAAFTANATSVTPGTTVNFTDQSTNTPTSWSWNFGGGGTPNTSTTQNPSIIFNTVGTYTVALTATNGVGNDTETKTSYITVSNSVVSCDTLHYPLTGTEALYTSDNGGYVSGTNGYEDKTKAEYFATYSPYTKINGVLVKFAIASKTSSATTNITFNVYNNSGTSGSPGTVIGTATASFATIISTTASQQSIYVPFSTAITIPGPFYVGVVLPTGVGDTLALVTNTDGDTNPGTGWEQFSDNTWYPYSDATNSWGSNISNAIFPVVCNGSVDINESSLENIQIYPNPANDALNIDLAGYVNEKINISVYNSVGQLITSVENDNVLPVVKIDLSAVKSGVYYVNIKTESGTITKKISIMK